jgi:hypothetical protein
MKTKGKHLQIKVRDKKTGESGWMDVYNLFEAFILIIDEVDSK